MPGIGTGMKIAASSTEVALEARELFLEEDWSEDYEDQMNEYGWTPELTPFNDPMAMAFGGGSVKENLYQRICFKMLIDFLNEYPAIKQKFEEFDDFTYWDLTYLAQRKSGIYYSASLARGEVQRYIDRAEMKLEDEEDS
jgi:hypothetical protein